MILESHVNFLLQTSLDIQRYHHFSAQIPCQENMIFLPNVTTKTLALCHP